jgi:hypothetical protein
MRKTFGDWSLVLDKVRAKERFQSLKQSIAKTQIQADQARAKAEQAEAATHQYASQLSVLYNSTYWRITAPLCRPVHQLCLLRQYGFKSRTKALTKRVLKQLALFMVARPQLRTLATRLAYHLGVAERLKPFVRSCLAPSPSANENAGSNNSPLALSKDLANLSPRARKIYTDLKVVIELRKKG